MTLTLLVLRHAHAAAPPPGTRDADRPLDARGQDEARTVGSRVRAAAPQVVLCSPARRARETLEALALPRSVLADTDPRLYLADADMLLDAVRDAGTLAEEAGTVLVVGHNPGLHELVLELTGGERIPRFPPAALAVLELEPDEWWQASPGSARLAALVLPTR